MVRRKREVKKERDIEEINIERRGQGRDEVEGRREVISSESRR